MMLGTDYVGIGTLVTAIAAALASLIVAWRQTGTIARVDEVHAAVSTSNGHTIGELVEKNEARHEAED